MVALKHYLPENPEELLALGPEMLAQRILRLLAGQSSPFGVHQSPFPLSRPTITLEGFTNWVRIANEQGTAGWSTNRKDEVNRAVMEAWAYLERAGLIAPVWHRHSRAYFVTDSGVQIAKDEAAWQEHREAQHLPTTLLHPVVQKAAWSNYLRGQYSVAVFAAMKEIEVAVREAAGEPPEAHGVPLMRRAFQVKPSSGPLTDTTIPEAEQEAVSHLFAGAVGFLKNPHGHRHEPLGASEAAEILVLASHLMRLVERRRESVSGDTAD